MRLLAGLVLAGDVAAKPGRLAVEDLRQALAALDMARCGHYVPEELARFALLYCADRNIRVTDDGAVWVGPRAGGEI